MSLHCEGTARTDIVNYGIHFMMTDASNAQNSMFETLKITSKYCWADVQGNERAYAEWEYWLDVHLVKDGTGRGCLALMGKHLERLVFGEIGLHWMGSHRCALSSMFLMRAPTIIKCR